MAFSEVQEKALKAKLSGKVVRTREQDGMSLSYVEGWHTIAEANRIFGFDGWDRKTVHSECVWEGKTEGLQGCSYVARVRVRVRAGDTVIVREGCGSGHGLGLNLGEAHESAIKEAETDAMKRALVTFGNPLGWRSMIVNGAVSGVPAVGMRTLEHPLPSAGRCSRRWVSA